MGTIKVGNKDETQKYEQQRPRYLKVDKGNKARFAFLTDEFESAIVYTLQDLTIPKDSNQNTFKGYYRSITSIDIPDLDEFKQAVMNNDSRLKVDALTLGDPTYLAIAPIFVYPIDRDGEVKKEVLAAHGYEVEFFRLTANQLEQVIEASRDLAKAGKTILDVDFVVNRPQNKQAWEIKADLLGESLYKKYKVKLQEKVDSLIKKEYTRLNVKDLKQYAENHLAFSLTEAKWYSKLSQYGYEVVGGPANGAKDDSAPSTAGGSDEAKPDENLFPPEEESAGDVVFE